MSAPTLPRNATRIRVSLPGRSDVDWAIERAVQAGIGDYQAKVFWYCIDGEGDFVIVVKQGSATWWAPMPDSLVELLGDWDGTFTLRWHDSEPPAEVEE